MPQNKKITLIALSIIGITALASLITSSIFISIINNTIQQKMDEFNINIETVMWIANKGNHVFGTSPTPGVVMVIIGLVTSILILLTFIIFGLLYKFKNINLNKTKQLLFLPITLFTTIALSLSMGGTLFAKSQAGSNNNAYFEKNAYTLAKDKQKGAESALLYTFLNKNAISGFAATFSSQIALSNIFFGDMYIKKLTNNPANALEDLLKDQKIKDEFTAIDKKNKFTDLKGQITTSYNWFLAVRDAASASDTFSAMMLNNAEGWKNILNGNYPNIQAVLTNYYLQNKIIPTKIFNLIPTNNKMILSQLGFVNYDTGKIKSNNILEFLKKSSIKSIDFKDKVIGTLGKLINLPYNTQEDKFKTQLTILEWLNTTVNSIDYISKNIKFQAFDASATNSKLNDGTLFKPIKLTTNPKVIYKPQYNQDGTITLDTTSNPIGKAGELMYDIKLKMMKNVLHNLNSKTFINKILFRQKNIDAVTFARHVIESKGLKEITDQYAVFNSSYDHGVYEKAQWIKDAQRTTNKIKEFIK